MLTSLPGLSSRSAGGDCNGFRLVEIPAIFYLGFWFVSQLLNGVLTVVAGTQGFGGVAWWAHVGGFVAGLVLAPLLAPSRSVRRSYVDEYFPW